MMLTFRKLCLIVLVKNLNVKDQVILLLAKTESLIFTSKGIYVNEARGGVLL